jgi:hypothetical protein
MDRPATSHRICLTQRADQSKGEATETSTSVAGFFGLLDLIRMSRQAGTCAHTIPGHRALFDLDIGLSSKAGSSQS